MGTRTSMSEGPSHERAQHVSDARDVLQTDENAACVYKIRLYEQPPPVRIRERNRKKMAGGISSVVADKDLGRPQILQ